MQAVIDFLLSNWVSVAAAAAGYAVRSFDPVGSLRAAWGAGRAKMRDIDDKRRGE